MKPIENLPALCQPEAHVDGDLIAFIEIDYDEGASNPLCDRGERIISLHRRHYNFNPDEFNSRRRDKDCVLLGAYDHGGILWYVTEDGPPPGADCPWDGVPVAGLWVPDPATLECVTKTKGKKRRRRALELARSACEVYTAWSNGEVYVYYVRVYKLRRSEDGTPFDHPDDYRFDDTLAEDSCCGFYLCRKEDHAYMLSHINQQLTHIEHE